MAEGNIGSGYCQVMLDAMPICGNCWSDENTLISCNEETVRLFGLPNKQAYLEHFDDFSPDFQPGGRRSRELAREHVKKAFEDGYVRFEWMHRDSKGVNIPCEVTLVRARYMDRYVVAGYTRDLRESIADMEKMREADERSQIMLDATPLCANFWDKDFNNIDCNEEAKKLFDLNSKQEYLDRFYELSPEYQPDGELSSVKSAAYIKRAFEGGYCRFDWMHQKLNGEPIPAEITLVRVKYKDDYIVVGYTRDLRELKATTAKMREADERTQLMLDATPLCCNLWNDSFQNIDCNQEAVNLFDLSNKREYLERFFELSPEYQPSGEKSAVLARKNIQTAFDTGYCRFDWMHQKLNGEPIPAEITLVRVKYKDGYIVAGYTRDLREMKAMLSKMREADERTQLMLDATPLCCNLWNQNFENIDCNQEAVKLFDLKSKQEYLDRFFELSPPFQPSGELSATLAQKNIQTAFNQGYCRFEWMHRKLNGDLIPSEITLVRVKHRGEDIVAGYTRDLRELKAMLSEMHKVEDDLRLARDAAEQSARAKSEFLANMSHEIRTPMNGILGLLHLALGTELTDKQREYLDKTKQSAQNLLRIINDILDFSKIEAGKLEMERVAFSVRDIFEELKDMYSAKIEESGLYFEVIEPEDLPESVVGDPLRLKQVLINLISNAAKFTKAGGITMEVRVTRSDSRCAQFRFSVRDTGIGLTDGQLRGLFAPFSQADTSITRKYGGTGLGLAISKDLVERMGGEVGVKSRFGEGSTFYFTARFEKAHEQGTGHSAAVNAPDRVRGEGGAPADHARILLAEDNEINQLIAQELLKSQGYLVDTANNGQEAIDMLKGNDYRLVLMDIQMPVMDGLTATCAIRAMEEYKTLPIIAMSANAMAGDYERSIECGMNDHLTKPIDADALFDTLKRWIG